MRLLPLVLAVLWFGFAAFVFVAPVFARATLFGWVAVLMGIMNVLRWFIYHRRRRRAAHDIPGIPDGPDSRRRYN